MQSLSERDGKCSVVLKRTLLRCKTGRGHENIMRCSPFPLELVLSFHSRDIVIFYINIINYCNIASIFITTKNDAGVCF